MSNQEILEKAIQKAIDGGFEMSKWLPDADNVDTFVYWLLNDSNSEGYHCLIFNHDFAKALWPIGNGKCRCGADIKGQHTGLGTHDMEYQWVSNLKQMVIADDPIKYLGENL